MKHTELDKKYYIIEVDGANNHPLLAWGNADSDPFDEETKIEEEELEFPIKVVFDDPYPSQYEMADLLSLGTIYAVSEKLKNLFESNNVYGVQFFPVEIETDKENIETGHYIMHFWNLLPAIDKNNFEGTIDKIGLVRNLKRFSVDEKLLDSIPFENRKVIRLEENPIMLLVHQDIYEAIKAEKLIGISFFRVDEWNTGSMFR
jgi:hypothetical protein